MDILIPSISLLASVITASLSYFFTKKHQFKMEERRLKEENYKIFMKALSDVAINNSNELALTKLSEAFNSSLIMASSGVIKYLMIYHELIKSSKTMNPDLFSKQHDEILTELIKTMRIDLFGKNKKLNKDFPLIHLLGGKK